MRYYMQYPKLNAVMKRNNLSWNREAGNLLDDLNYVLQPLGFREIGGLESIAKTLKEAEDFLTAREKSEREK